MKSGSSSKLSSHHTGRALPERVTLEPVGQSGRAVCLSPAGERWVGRARRVRRNPRVGVAGITVEGAAALGHRLVFFARMPHMVVRLLAVFGVCVPAFVDGRLTFPAATLE